MQRRDFLGSAGIATAAGALAMTLTVRPGAVRAARQGQDRLSAEDDAGGALPGRQGRCSSAAPSRWAPRCCSIRQQRRAHPAAPGRGAARCRRAGDRAAAGRHRHRRRPGRQGARARRPGDRLRFHAAGHAARPDGDAGQLGRRQAAGRGHAGLADREEGPGRGPRGADQGAARRFQRRGAEQRLSRAAAGPAAPARAGRGALARQLVRRRGQDHGREPAAQVRQQDRRVHLQQ